MLCYDCEHTFYLSLIITIGNAILFIHNICPALRTLPTTLKVWKGDINILTSSPNQDFSSMAGVIFHTRVKVIHLSSYPLPNVVVISSQL